MMMAAMSSLQLLQFHPFPSWSSSSSSSSLPTLRHHHPPLTTVSPLLLHYDSPPIRRRPVFVGKEETELRVSSDQQEDPSSEDLEYVSQIQRVISIPSLKPRFLSLVYFPPYFLFAKKIVLDLIDWDSCLMLNYLLVSFILLNCSLNDPFA